MRKISFCTIIAIVFSSICNAQDKIASIQIGTQTWTSENLDVIEFRNGNKIQQITSDMEWIMADAKKEPAWCYLNFDEKNKKYGKLYNGHAVLDMRGLAPKGWKIPSDEDWKKLEIYIDKNSDLLKEEGTNTTGFNAVCSGSVNVNGIYTEEVFSAWSSTKVTNTSAFYRRMFSYNNTIERKVNKLGSGAYIRCIKE